MADGPIIADHRVHGVGMELEAPAWPAITLAEAAAVLADFPAAGHLVALRWHSPRPFSAATLLQTSAGTFVLKRHHQRVRTPHSLAEEHGFIAHLRSAGLAVPDIIAASDGAGAIGLGEWTYELHRASSGIDAYGERQSWTPFLNHGHAVAAGAALARLHLAAREYAADARGPHPLVASFTIVPASDPLAAAAAYVDARPALGAFLADLPWRQELTRLFTVLGGGLSERLAGQPSLWTHNDWHPSNLLWSPEGMVSTVFDFGLATRTCAIHDIATAIERTAIPWLQFDNAPADADAALALLAGYRTVLPLGAVEVETIARLLPLVHIEFALSEVDYFAGIRGDRDHAMVAWQGYLIDHANWFLSAPGQAFLRRIASGAST